MCRNRIFCNQMHPLDACDDEKLNKKFRFHHLDILTITDQVRGDTEMANQLGNLPCTLQVSMGLRFFAIGSFQTVCVDLFQISKSTASQITTRVTQVLLGRVRERIRFPDQQEADRQKSKFRDMHGLLNVFSCVNGTLIPIQAPSEFEQEYSCQKNKMCR